MTKWKTKNGEIILINKMTDGHLINSTKMLIRDAKGICDSEVGACWSINFGGEQAQIEQDRFLANADYTDYLPKVILNLIQELNRRDLGNQIPELFYIQEKLEP